MDSRQQATHDALYQIDPELAGLFARGCELVDRIEDAGVRYLIGHIGRELSKAVLAVIVRELPAVADPPRSTLYAGREDSLRAEIARVVGLELEDTRLDAILAILGEGHRETIARALSLDSKHPLVSSWLHLQKALVAATHYRKGAPLPSAENVRDAFYKLAGLLFNRVGPYFHAQNDLDALLEISDPQTDDLVRLRELLVRPQLRFRFFGSLQNVAWIGLLREAGVFDHPPEWVSAPDGRRSVVPWPEGECLVRFATQRPEQVVESLLGVPLELQNPAVWEVVARAMLSLPPAIARKLVPRFERALQLPHSRFFGDTAIKVATRLAEAGDDSAFRLTKALLGLRPILKDDGPDETKWFRFRSGALLESLDPYELEDLLAKVVPALSGLDEVRTWSLLIERIRRAQHLATAAGFDDQGLSHHWCESLDSAEGGDDIRAQLAVAAMSVARQTIAKEPSRIETVLESLPDGDVGLFARMRISLLTAAGPNAREQIDRVISDPQILDPPFGAREAAMLLRIHFESASPEAREALIRALKSGPGEAELRSIAEWRGEDPEDEAARHKALGDWQSKRLRWFHDRIPTEFRAVAVELGVEPESPSLERQALDEVGFYSPGVYSRGEISPRSGEELRALADGDLLSLLETWQPSGESDLSPSRRGLAETLTAVVAEDPAARAVFIGMVATREGLHPTYRRAVLEGLRKAADASRAISWTEAVELVAGTLEAAERSSAVVDRNDWGWARREAVDFLQEACSGNRLPSSLGGRAFEIVEFAVRSSPAWFRDSSVKIRQFGDVLFATLNSEAGKTTYLLVAVALWAHRIGGGVPGPDPGQVRLLLELMRTREDTGRVAVRARIGEFLPQVLLIDREWVLRNADDLFASGMEDSLGNPTWGAYLTAGRLYHEAFGTLRPWFGQHAGAVAKMVATENSIEKLDRQWCVSRHYLEQAGKAHLYGYLAREEPDRALELIFEGSRAEDRAHLYWQIFRGWSDAKEAPQDDYVERLLSLWQWRLDVLEAASDGEELAEESDGLGWFILTPHLPDARVLLLAARTMRLASGRGHTRRNTWPRLAQLGVLDPAAVTQMAEQLITAQLADQWPHFDFDQVAPVLRIGLAASDSGVRSRAERLVHRLGDRGWTEFGRLLRGGDGPSH
jgi:hypothetical protein